MVPTMSLEVEAQKFEITVKVKARNSGDPKFFGASSNEYQVILGLYEELDIAYQNGQTATFMSRIAPLKGGDVAHNAGILSPYETLKMGEELTRKTIISLPTNVMVETYLKVFVYESDFTIPVPIPCGGCVIPVNEDDLDLEKTFPLADGEQNLNIVTELSEIDITIKLIDEKIRDLKNVIDEQERHIFPNSTFGPNLNYLKNHVIKYL